MKIISGKRYTVGPALFVLTLIVIVTACGGKTDPTFNIAGTWSLFRTTAGSDTTQAAEQKDIFAFTTSDNDVGGTNQSSGETVTGQVTALDVTLTTSGSSGTKNYTGRLSSDGATMSGTWSSTDPAGQPGPSGTWIAVVHGLITYDITGDWNLSEPAGGLDGVQGFTLSQSVNDLTGSTTPATDPAISITGTVGSLDVIFFWTGSNGAIVTLTGKIIDAGSMSGTWTDTNGLSGSWSASKNG